MDQLAEMKERAKGVWALGDYPAVARRFEGVADAMVCACGIGEGAEVLDVAAGNGNVAIAAARAGARVTASDFTPQLLEAGRARTKELGLDVRWDEADAEELPYADASFDAVTSVFGLMFAPRPEVAAAEAFRVLRPGGVLGVAAWTPEGSTGRMTAVMGRYLPQPPGVARPSDWGDEATARERLAPHAADIRCERGHVVWEFASVEDAFAFQEETFGALIAARSVLGERYPEVREELAGLFREFDEGDGDRVRVPAEYLLVTARKAA